MNPVDAMAGENEMRGLIGTAFTGGEPALPDVDAVMLDVEFLGGQIRHRQRVRNGIAAFALCVGGFGMVAGIAAIENSAHPGGGTIVVPGGSGGPAMPGDAISNNGGRPDTGP